MDRLIATNSVTEGNADTAPVTGTPQFATDGNPQTNTPATVWPAYQYNAIQEEIVAVLTAAGITPDRTNNGQLLAAIQGWSGKNMRAFGSSGTFTVPAGVTTVHVRGWGGGGGGGGCNYASGGGGGGGGGAYFENFYAVTPGQQIAVTIGSMGAAGTTSPSAGGAGGATSFGSLGSAAGGGGGSPASSGFPFPAAGAGGVASGGTGALTGNGSSGSTGEMVGPVAVGGSGGGAWGFGAAIPAIGSGPGNAGFFPGQGGNGGGAVYAGAVGALGLLIADW